MKLLSIPRVLRYIFAGIMFGCFLVVLHEVVPILGVNNPAVDPMIDFAKGAFWSLLFLAIIFLTPVRSDERGSLVLLWIARVAMTLGVMLFYEFKYDRSLDAYYYYKVAIHGLGFHENFLNLRGTELIGQVANVFNSSLPLMDSYHALKVLWAFFGLLGLYFFYMAYEDYTEKRDIKLLLFLGLFPSMAFWSSILGKDPLTFLGIGILFYCFLGLLKQFKVQYIVLAPIGVIILYMIRPWLVGLFILPFAIVFTFRSRIHIFMKCLIFLVAVGFMGAFSGYLSNMFQVSSQQELIETSNALSRKWAFGGSGNEVAAIRSLGDFLLFLPKGMFTALYRPLPGEVLNAFGLFSGFESLFLLCLLIFSISKASMKIIMDPLVQLSIATLAVWSAAYGFISIQNMGTAVRFKLQVLPILIILPYYILQKSRHANKNFEEPEVVEQ